MSGSSGTDTRRKVLLFAFLVTGYLLSGQNQPDARSFQVEGLRYLSEDNPYGAVDSFRSALMLNPSYAEARLGMAEALFLLGEYEEANRELQMARPYTAGRRELSLMEGRILTALARYDEAARIYQELLASRPHDAEANRGLAEIYAVTGQRELADAAYGRSLLYSPGDRRVLLQLVLLHDAAREKNLADSVMQEALRRYPDNLSVRIQAAEHYALYNEWDTALDHLERARSMMSGTTDQRYPGISSLEAELSLRRGDPAAAVKALSAIPQPESPQSLYLLARAYRDLGEEEKAQNHLQRLLNRYGDDEIVRIYREERLMLTYSGFREQRKDAAAWHLARGRSYEENYYFRRAYNEYRRAKLIFKDDPAVWMAYTNILNRMGYPEHYRDSLEAALMDIPAGSREYGTLKRRLDLLSHSESPSIAERWGVEDPWILPSSEWKIAVYYEKGSSSLPIHPGSEATLSLYLADLLDVDAGLQVMAGSGSSGSLETREAEDFAQAFRDSRGRADYFIVLNFTETERTFSAAARLYIARTGELTGVFNEFRTGQGRVTDSLHFLAESLASAVPEIIGIEQIDGSEVLLNKGRWHGVEEGTQWIVIRGGGARPANVDGGLAWQSGDYLGTVDIVDISEPVSVGAFQRSGDFDFVSRGDQLFLLPVPQNAEETPPRPDPAFKARLLAIP